jgi:hypothetical protein
MESHPSMSRLLSAASATLNCPSPRVESASDVCGPLGILIIDRPVRGIVSADGRMSPSGSAEGSAHLVRSMTDIRALVSLRPKVEGPIRAEGARGLYETSLGMTNLDLISVDRQDEPAEEGATAR